MTRHKRIGAAQRLGLTVGLIASATTLGLAFGQQTRTYTTSADFAEGTLSNVNSVAVADQLQLDVVPPSASLAFADFACSERGTIVRVNALTGQVLGEYQTAPNPLAKNPSRTSVDQFGNVWVGNRAEGSGGKGSVCKIGIVVGGTRVDANGAPNPNGQYLKPPFQYSTAVDRDGDGLIRTSRGLGDILQWPNITDGAGGANGIVQDALDETILVFQRTTGIQIRTVAVDANNDVWVGGYPFFPTAFDKLNGSNGAILTSFSASTIGCGGNGGLVDGAGILWSESHLESTILRYNPVTTASTCIPVVNSSGIASLPHGIAVDTNGFIWVAQFNDDEVSKYDAAGNLIAGFPVPSGGASLDRSLAVTPVDNDVWVGNSAGNDVSRLANDGTIRKVISLGAGISPRGVSVDPAGKVWVANFGSNNAMRIDPNGGFDGLGAVDLTVDLGPNASPENYSDFTGEVPLDVFQSNGTWTVTYDSGVINTEFGRISYNGQEPAGTSLVVEFRAANAQADLRALSFQPVVNGQLFSGVFGRFVQIRTSFNRATPQTLASPVLFDLTIESLGGGGPETQCTSGQRNPGSLLIYPEFDNRAGDLTLLTITNTDDDQSFVAPNIAGGTTKVEFVYIGRYGLDNQVIDCVEFNRTETLTPNDTLTLVTKVHNPQMNQGYVYAFAKDPITGQAIVHNFLIGSTLILSGIDAIDYSHNAFVHLGVGPEGSTTDDDGDGIRDLNGFEYCPAPDEILVPRFLEQRRGIESQLVLINLSGGPEFTALIDFMIYNDNEEAFSAQTSVQCWAKKRLVQISNAFSEHFLTFATNNAPNEVFGLPSLETGWFRMNGRTASSGQATIQDPAFLALLIEHVGSYAASDLPFETGQQDNGDLLADGPFGDLSK